MNLRKRVIESTIIAVMLTVVTAVTAVMQTASVENVPEPQQETKAVADVQADGSAGIIEELASLGDAATEQASIERADVVVVAEAQEEEPQLSEEQQAWNSKLMADVDDFLYIRSSADGESEVIGKLYKGAAADIVETLDGWYHITSGSVDGYVKSEYCVAGQEAYAYAQTVCDTVATVTTGGLRVRSEANPDASVIKAASEGDKLVVDTQTRISGRMGRSQLKEFHCICICRLCNRILKCSISSFHGRRKSCIGREGCRRGSKESCTDYNNHGNTECICSSKL